MEIEDQGRLRVVSGCRNPNRQCRGFFDFEKVSQDNTNSLTAFHIWGHQKSQEMNSNILLNPKCPAAGKS
jgi:hypothetical protein